MTINSSNRFGWDYQALSATFPFRFPRIVDIHSHIVGGKAAEIYQRVARQYGITMTFSMTPLPYVDPVKKVLGDSVHFIAVPEWHDPDPERAFGPRFIQTMEKFYELGSRVVKFWSAPRGIDIGYRANNPALLKIDAPHRIESMKRATELGMIMMAHVGDPDTWFATRYTDSLRYGTKREQYVGFERALDQFPTPWIAAHMGGWPEDLNFLDGMLERHPNLYLDSSATKWMVRELSKHSREELLGFMTRWKGRVLFGSDIVTNDDHLIPETTGNEMADKAGSAEQAYDLYASRYWALRTMFETDFSGESPIADPDLALVNPARYSPLDAPRLEGKSFPEELLHVFYYQAVETLMKHVQP